MTGADISTRPHDGLVGCRYDHRRRPQHVCSRAILIKLYAVAVIVVQSPVFACPRYLVLAFPPPTSSIRTRSRESTPGDRADAISRWPCRAGVERRASLGRVLSDVRRHVPCAARRNECFRVVTAISTQRHAATAAEIAPQHLAAPTQLILQATDPPAFVQGSVGSPSRTCRDMHTCADE